MLIACGTSGCSGLTLGPTIERRAIIVHPGVGIEILDNVTVEARAIREDGPTDTFEQDIGGWIAMPPDHWDTVKREIKRLREKAGEQ